MARQRCKAMHCTCTCSVRHESSRHLGTAERAIHRSLHAHVERANEVARTKRRETRADSCRGFVQTTSGQEIERCSTRPDIAAL